MNWNYKQERPFQNVSVWSRSRRAKILTTEIHGVFRGLKTDVCYIETTAKGVNSCGFTLLELLISISILVIIVIIAGSCIRLGYRSVNAGEKKMDSLERLRSSMRIVDAQLQSQVPLTYDGEDGRRFYFEGDETSLRFTTNYSVWDGRRGYIIAAYRIETDDYGKRVMFVTENVIGSAVKREAMLFDDLDEINFYYFNKGILNEGIWGEQLTDTTDIPQKIRINLVRGTKKYSLLIPLRARGTLTQIGMIHEDGS
ncbi:MAG: prepilin-type N-terminal cleavage/methylation domain-containing protein [Proteobacteria bacterium]|nr:prepilin-type N-terminal cleavage/methylation domain-containing protein [Pseudomonadota bacterium]